MHDDYLLYKRLVKKGLKNEDDARLDDLTRRILRFLSDQQNPVALPVLIEASGVSFPEVSDVVKTLVKIKMVELNKGAGGEEIQITDLGNSVAAFS